MSTTTEPVTFSDLQTDFLSRMKMGSGTTEVTTAKRLINTALVNMHQNPGSKFPWLERRGVVITHAIYNTGTVSVVTATSRTAITGASTLWNTAVPGFGFNNARVGGKIKLAGLTENYEVSAVGSDTSITLATRYTGVDLSGVSYVYFEDEYDLESDFGSLIDARNFSTAWHMPVMARTDFRRMYVRNDLFQRPKVATLIQLRFSGTTAPRHRVVFHPVPNGNYSIPYSYNTTLLAVTAAGVEQSRLENDTDEPIVPRGKRQAITLYAKHEYYLDYKDDGRAAVAFQEYVDYMTRISGDVNLGDARPQFYIRRRQGGGVRQRFDMGDRFDQIRDR
jgi:hypothetical protein